MSEKVLVTGGSGFIANQLIPRLIDRGYHVYSLDIMEQNVIDRQRRVKSVFGDLKDNTSITNIIREVEPEYVIHLASISSVSYSYDHPIEVLESNFIGTVNLAEACLRFSPHLKHFLFAGSSEEYGNQEKFPVKEDAEMHPCSPYAVSKVAADKYLQYMRDAYGFPITVLRNFNTYGRKDNSQYVIEDVIVQMLKGSKVMLGDPTPTRDFVYVDDHVDSYLTCLGNPKALGGIFNFCTGRGVSIREVVELIGRIIDFNGEVVWNTKPARPKDIKIMVGDSGKAKSVLGWVPKYSLEDGLKETINFWEAKLSKH